MQDQITYNNHLELWDRYNKVRLAGDKKSANKILIEFIRLLKQQSKDVIQEFSDSLCADVLESNTILSNNGDAASHAKNRIQHQLFRDILVPVLEEKFKAGSSKHMRWIAQLEQFFYSDYNTAKNFLARIEVPFPFDTIYFLKKSYSLSQSERTLELLLSRIHQDISYAIHELPMGVIYEPDTFDEMVEEFIKYNELYYKRKNWNSQIKDWKLIGKHWRIYLSNQEGFDNFDQYLKVNEVIINY